MVFRSFLIPVILFFLTAFTFFFFMNRPLEAEKIKWGVNFSQKHTQKLGLDWKKVYLAILDDLKTRNLKISVDWDMIEPERGEYNFQDLDWQIQEAEKRKAKIILVLGFKTLRWPECHIPDWAKTLNQEEQQTRILELIEKIVLRYKKSPAIAIWQVENEPFFPFGVCPWQDKEFLKKEIKLVKSLDQRPVLISDSGEGSFWIQAAKLGDIVGTTMYKTVWVKPLKRYLNYPFPPSFYWWKARLIHYLFGKRVIVVELQAEPWGPTLLYDSPLKEQKKTMNLEKFKEMIDFARKTGFDEFYFWGAEWWFWLKEKHNDPSFWNLAKKTINQAP